MTNTHTLLGKKQNTRLLRELHSSEKVTSRLSVFIHINIANHACFISFSCLLRTHNESGMVAADSLLRKQSYIH